MFTSTSNFLRKATIEAKSNYSLNFLFFPVKFKEKMKLYAVVVRGAVELLTTVDKMLN